MKKLLICILATMQSIMILAQSQGSCSLPEPITTQMGCSVAHSTTQSEWWFSTVPDSSRFGVYVSNSNGVMQYLTLYSGSCGNLSIIAFDSISTDSSLSIRTNAVIPGNTYLIKLSRDLIPPGCSTCVDPTADFQVCVENIMGLRPSITISSALSGSFQCPFPNISCGPVPVPSCGITVCTGEQVSFTTYSTGLQSIPFNFFTTGNCNGANAHILWTFNGSTTTPQLSTISSAVVNQEITIPNVTWYVPGTYVVDILFESDCNDCQAYSGGNIYEWLIPVTVTGVNLTPTISQVSCFGGNNGSISLVNDPNTYYVWSPTNQTGSTVSGLSAGTYTVTATGQCESVGVYTITEPTALHVSTIENPEDCDISNNGSSQASVTGGVPGYTYNWSTTPVQTTALATGLDAGTYTLTVTDANGCIATAQATVNTDPLPPAPLVLASYGDLPNLCTVGQIITYTVTNHDPNLTYVPTFSPTPSTAVESPAGVWTVDWGSACTDISFTLSVYNGNVICTNSTTLTLPGCCGLCNQTSNDALTDGSTISTVQQFAAAYPALVTVAGNTYTYTNPNGILYVNGNLNVSGGIVFQIINSEVQLGTNAALVLNDFTANTIEISGSHLHASCGDMWKGILANGTNNSIKVNNNSLIEDAIWAVQSASGATYQLKESVFNKNNESVAASQYGSTHPGTIENCVFTCRELAATDNIASTKGNQSAGFIQVFPIANFNTATLLPPYAGKRSYAGVTINRVGLEQLDANNQLINVTNITVGTAGGYNELNVFDNLDYGVYAVNSNVQVINNAFQYITASSQPQHSLPQIGTAVFGSTNGLYTNKEFIVGDPQTNNNTFYDCGRGVDLNGFYHVSIRNNNFQSTIAYSSLFGFSPVGNIAAFVKSGRYINVDVMENHVVNWDLGIYFIGDVYQINNHLYQKYYGDAHLDLNIIEPVLNNGAPGTEYIRNAIIAQNLLPVYCSLPNCEVQYNNNPQMGRLYIDQNTINNAYNGITKQGWIKMPRCANNTININQQPVGPFGLLPQHGIRVIDCFEPVDYSNFITGPGTGQQDIRGIYHTNNYAPFVHCNDIDQIGQCIVFEGSNIKGTFYDNIFRESQDGYVLLNNGKIGDQGYPPMSSNNFDGLSSDNQYIGPFSHADTYTDNTFTPQLHSILYVRSGYPFEPAVNLTNGTSALDNYVLNQSYFIVNGQAPRDCNLPAPIAEGGGAGGEKKVLENIATSLTEETGFVAETRWQDQQRTYEALKTDSTLMDTSTVLQGFYSEMQVSPTELIAVVDQKIAADDLSGAAAINSAIEPESIIEQNYITFNAVYLKCLAGDTLLQSDLDSLEALAAQCPLSGGRAVFRARVLLCVVDNTYRSWVDNCDIPPSTARRANPQQLTTTVAADNHVQLYPNPNNGQMVLTYSVEGSASFVLFNAMGQVVDTKTLLSGEHNLSITENLAPGVYYYQVKDGEKIIKQDKITIIQ